MDKFILNKPEATYYLLGNHFAFDCKCNKNPRGNSLKEADEIIERVVYDYKSYIKENHTFYMNESLFLTVLEGNAELSNEPIVLVCKNCEQEFKFTQESYEDLVKQIYINASIS